MAKQKNIEGGLGGTLQIERRSIAELSNDPANARKHNDKNIEAIIASLRRFGQQKPIVIDRNNIVRAGNGTLEAARRLGWDSIDCVKTSLEGSDAIAYAIADNRTAELAEWDDNVLAAQLNGLLTESEEIALAAGWTAEEIEAMVALAEDDPEITEDDVPVPPVDPITKPGDLWILGDHRLLCGDSTKAEDVGRLMAGKKVDSVVTDPPYGMEFRSNYRKTKHEAISGDASTDCLNHAVRIKATHSVYAWCRWDNVPDVPRPSSLITWVKNNWSMGDLEHEHARQTEVCLFYPGESHRWPGKRPTDVVNHARTGNDLHPTQKPVSLMADVVGWTTGLIYDPFLGSGTTLMAAEQLNRKCYGMEISPQYCDVIVKRWETLTGNKALLEQ